MDLTSWLKMWFSKHPLKEPTALDERAFTREVMARVDILLDSQDRPYVLEVNTIPGLTGKSLLPKAAKAKGIDFPELCVRILELSQARKRHGQTVKN